MIPRLLLSTSLNFFSHYKLSDSIFYRKVSISLDTMNKIVQFFSGLFFVFFLCFQTYAQVEIKIYNAENKILGEFKPEIKHSISGDELMVEFTPHWVEDTAVCKNCNYGLVLNENDIDISNAKPIESILTFVNSQSNYTKIVNDNNVVPYNKIKFKINFNVEPKNIDIVFNFKEFWNGKDKIKLLPGEQKSLTLTINNLQKNDSVLNSNNLNDHLQKKYDFKELFTMLDELEKQQNNITENDSTKIDVLNKSFAKYFIRKNEAFSLIKKNKWDKDKDNKKNMLNIEERLNKINEKLDSYAQLEVKKLLDPYKSFINIQINLIDSLLNSYTLNSTVDSLLKTEQNLAIDKTNIEKIKTKENELYEQIKNNKIFKESGSSQLLFVTRHENFIDKYEVFTFMQNVWIEDINSQILYIHSSKNKYNWIYIIVLIVIVVSVIVYFIVSKKNKIKMNYRQAQEGEIILQNVNETKREIVAGEITSVNDLPKGYYEIDLTKIWDSTHVNKCYLHPSIVQIINVFSSKSVDGSLEIAPEVGGFLLGKFYCVDKHTEKYDIYISTFVEPSEVEHQDQYQLSFGTKAMIELDSALQTHKDLTLIGWFHTHPNHGPFLSMPDLNIHNGSFRYNYQVAIVLDTYTPEFDTGIFSRIPKTDASLEMPLMNNRMEPKNGKKIVKWEQIYNEVRKNNGNSMIEPKIVENNISQQKNDSTFSLNLLEIWDARMSLVASVELTRKVLSELNTKRIESKSDVFSKGVPDLYLYGDIEKGNDETYRLNIYQTTTEIQSENQDKLVGWVAYSQHKLSDLNKAVEMIEKTTPLPVRHIAVIVDSYDASDVRLCILPSRPATGKANPIDSNTKTYSYTDTILKWLRNFTTVNK